MNLLPFLALLTSQDPQDPKQPSSKTVTGHILRPGIKAPTPELISGLQAPEGFRVERWAEGLENPRIVKIRPDGTVCATQRKAQNIVMLKAFAIVMEDPDAAAPKPFTHWLAGDLPAMTTIPVEVLPGDRPVKLPGGVQGGNSHGSVAFYGLKPPQGDPPHRYHFTLYALDAKLGLKPGFNRQGLLKAMQGHVLGQGTTIGRFRK